MEQSIAPTKRKQTVPALLFVLFLMTELAGSLWPTLAYLYDFYYPNNFFDPLIKTAILSLLIVLAYQKKLWAIWVAGVLLIIQGLAYIYLIWNSGDRESVLFLFYFLGFYDCAFGLYIICFRLCKARDTKKFTTSSVDQS
jgi:hypothetical protein